MAALSCALRAGPLRSPGTVVIFAGCGARHVPPKPVRWRFTRTASPLAAVRGACGCPARRRALPQSPAVV